MLFLICLSALFCFCSILPVHAQEISCQVAEESIENPALTLYYAPWCYYCHKVINYLKRINKQVPLKDVQNPLNKEKLVTIGGKRQVPCLVIDGVALYESSDIIAWLSAHQDLLEDIK